ncbi:unnamed protein product [Pelagomonas calceolata]|uniref:Uncharacterized protein n=1 Tax=Pelagomonas calceolata TaxID=35677 RepID=A0A8J2SM57_9STRA|nr:unnamed protein product [Pelagomonas calceolata]
MRPPFGGRLLRLLLLLDHHLLDDLLLLDEKRPDDALPHALGAAAAAVRARDGALALVRVFVGERREVLDARQRRAAVAALRALALLAPVGADEAAARRLDDLEHIALRRVGVAPRESDPDVLHRCFG